MANLKKEFQGIAQFKVMVNGKPTNVSATVFRREHKKYIDLGYGMYFDIPQAEAISRAAKATAKIVKAAKDKEADLQKVKRQSENKDKALVALDGEVKKLDGELTEAKTLVDKQQSENGKLVQEKSKLTKANKAAKDENDKLKKQMEAMKAKLEENKK